MSYVDINITVGGIVQSDYCNVKEKSISPELKYFTRTNGIKSDDCFEIPCYLSPSISSSLLWSKFKNASFFLRSRNESLVAGLSFDLPTISGKPTVSLESNSFYFITPITKLITDNNFRFSGGKNKVDVITSSIKGNDFLKKIDKNITPKNLNYYELCRYLMMYLEAISVDSDNIDLDSFIRFSNVSIKSTSDLANAWKEYKDGN